jgi:NAD+ diphosphatase
MRDAERVTFGGGGGLDRAAGLRGDAQALAAWRADPAAGVLPLWRGKPLVAGDGRDRLGLVSPRHPVLAQAAPDWLFLGLAEGRALFAADLSSWEPTGLDPAAQGAFFDPTEQQHPALPDDHRFAELRGVMARLPPFDAELAATARGLLEWHRTHGHCARCGAGSTVTQAGWQRQCPACGAAHFPRTDPVVIMLVTRGNRVLLGRSPGWPDGMYSLLAGFVEPGETVQAAVRREVAEETGVPVGAVRFLASQPWPFPASLMLGCAAEATGDAITVDPAELEDACWLTREALVEVMGNRHPRIRPARRGAIAHFLLQAWLADRLD